MGCSRCSRTRWPAGGTRRTFSGSGVRCGKLGEDSPDLLNVHVLVTHVLRKTVASHLDDAKVQRRKISDQLGHSRMAMTEDYYITRSLTDRATADALEDLLEYPESSKRTPPSMMTKESKPLTWEDAPPTGLEPVTLRLTVACSAN